MRQRSGEAHVDFRKEVGAKILTASKLKEYFKAIGINSSGDLPDGIADVVYKAMWRAMQRAYENGRKTVRPCDF